MISTLSHSILVFAASACICNAFVAPAPSFSARRPPQLQLPHRYDTDASNAFAALNLSSTSIIDTTSSLLLCSDESVINPAQIVGYLVGVGSFLLYSPIAVRLLRTRSAEGLTISTWWMKVAAFTCLDTYNVKHGYPISSWSESMVNTVESGFVLCLVCYFQKQVNWTTFLLGTTYITASSWALFAPASIGPSDELISLAQIISIVLNTSALLPQIKQNFERQSSGDYSTITALVAMAICGTRLYTTMELANGDPLLLLNYGVLFLLNLGLLAQVLYYGTAVEGKELTSLFLADIKSDDSNVIEANYVKDSTLVMEDVDGIGNVTNNPIMAKIYDMINVKNDADERVQTVSKKSS